MQFSDTSGKQGIIEDITFLTGQDTNSYVLADRLRNVNLRASLIWTIIFESYGGWKFMDDNQSDASTGLPYADQTITSGTGLYALPSGSLLVDGIEMMNAAGTPMRRLYPLTHEEFLERGGDSAYPSNGMPNNYMLQGDIIRLLPTPNFTLASALRVFFGKDFTAFIVSDTTATPGFAGPFHRMLSVGASMDFKITEQLQGMWNDYELRLRSFYSKRFRDRFPNKIGAGPDIVEQYS